MLKWAPPTAEPAKQLEDWTKGKTISYAVFDGISPTGDSEQGVAATSIAQLWGKALPKLLMSKSDVDFDKVFSEFIEKREAAGFDKVLEYQQSEYEKNKKKLGL